MGVVAPRPDEKRRHQEAVVEVVDRPHLVQLVEVGAVEALARVVVAEEGADLFHSFLAEVVGDLLCSAIAVKDLRSVAVAAAVVAVEVADLRYLSRVVVGAVEALRCLARVVMAEEGADLLHSFLAVVAEVLRDFLCSAIAVEDPRSVTVVVAAVEVADLLRPFREVVAAVGVLVSILHLFQGVVEVVGDLYNLEEEAMEVEL